MTAPIAPAADLLSCVVEHCHCSVSISYDAAAFGGVSRHLTFRGLSGVHPLTATGYKSHFYPPSEQTDDWQAFALRLLTNAAEGSKSTTAQADADAGQTDLFR